ncbi:MAG: L,D-transpeptidase [Gammaproteobacteria bacterium]
MNKSKQWKYYFLFGLIFLTLGGCASQSEPMLSSEDFNGLPLYHGQAPYSSSFNEAKFASALPQNINTREKVIVVDPKVYAWGAYSEEGRLIRAGIASAGADFCEDEGRPCHTSTGTFRIYSMGNQDCISHQYPVGKGGSLMPYCMFFHKGESLHGSPDQMMVENNISHGCVHMRIPDVEWLRYNFAEVGTKVMVLPY